MTFPQAPDHPLLRDVRAEDLKYWRGDHTVTDAEPVRPMDGACVPVVVSGSALGINQAPLMVLPRGNGAFIVCQMKVVAKADEEPTAGVLLRNMLDYATAYRAPAGKTALWSDLPAMRKKLDELGVETDDVTGKLAETDLSQYGLLLCASASADPIVAVLDRLVPWVERGGKVLLHGLAPEEYGKLAQTLDPALTLAPYRGHALKAAEATATSGTDTETRNGTSFGVSPLEWFTNEDLYWLGEHTGISWSTTPLAQTTATAAFERALQREAAKEYPAVDMKLTGGIVGKIEGGEGVYFATVGTGKLAIDFPESRDYVVGVVARGTPVDEVYPIGEVHVDGRSLGSISIRNNEWQTYTTFGHVDAGTHEVEVAFTNDASRPPNQDRNMYVKSVLVAPAQATTRSEFLTQPAALVRFPRGQGSFVVDNITWDTEEANGAKATRFVCGLLTGLGARFSSRIGVVVQAEDMEPQPGMRYFSKGGGRVTIATAGYIETEVEVARAGHYRVELVAGGSPAAGVYPIVEVATNGRSIGQVELTTGSLKPYLLEADLAEGVQKLRVTFTNDSNVGGEDRNLYVGRVVFYGPE